MLAKASGSAARVVNLLAEEFSCFRDEHEFEGASKPIRFLKRAQILVADLWACFNGESYGAFSDIDKITMFADYRVPQMLISLGALCCSPSVATAIKRHKIIESGSSWEVQLRGRHPTFPGIGEPKEFPDRSTACSIWCVELMQREILKRDPSTHVNAILIDFFLYDTMKELEAAGEEPFPHHRTRSIWY